MYFTYFGSIVHDWGVMDAWMMFSELSLWCLILPSPPPAHLPSQWRAWGGGQGGGVASQLHIISPLEQPVAVLVIGAGKWH